MCVCVCVCVCVFWGERACGGRHRRALHNLASHRPAAPTHPPARPCAAQVGGAILADEMGLGKTAQAICFLGVLSDWENDRWAFLGGGGVEGAHGAGSNARSRAGITAPARQVGGRVPRKAGKPKLCRRRRSRRPAAVAVVGQRRQERAGDAGEEQHAHEEADHGVVVLAKGVVGALVRVEARGVHLRAGGGGGGCEAG